LPRFSIVVETRYENNNGITENVIIFHICFFNDFKYLLLLFKCHNLPPDELAVRKLEYLDIATERVADYKYKESEDPCKFKSLTTGRGPLTATWRVSFNNDTVFLFV